MASEDIDTVADIALAASRQFTDRHPGAKTEVGVISSKIRAMGVQADAVNIDCGRTDQRLVLILLDQTPGRVGIGVGQRETVGNYQLIGQVAVDELKVEALLDILEARFAIEGI